MLAITNAIRRTFSIRRRRRKLHARLRDMYPWNALRERYKMEPDPELNGYELLEQAAKKRGFRFTRRV